MIDPQAILKQVRQGDIPDNWQVFRYTDFSLGRVLRMWAICMVAPMSTLLGRLLFEGLSLPEFLPIFLIPIFALPLCACMLAWQHGVASLVIIPDGVIHVVNDLYLLSHFDRLTPEGKRGRADYRSKVMHSLSKHTYAWYPCKILSFADIASIQLKVSYVRGIWLELYYHNGERKKWLIETHLNSAAIQSAQSIIVAYTYYIAEHPQPIEQA